MTSKTFSRKIEAGLQQTYRNLVLQKRRDKEMLIFSENGQVQYVDPNSIDM